MTRYRSKSLAVWIAIVGGALGFHRFYLKGLSDWIGWLFPLPTLLGLIGLRRMDLLGQDDRLAWVLLPCLGLTLSIAMLSAIVYALTPDDRWDARHNPAATTRNTAWAPVLGAVVSLLVGATVLISTIAFSIQKLFESQV